MSENGNPKDKSSHRGISSTAKVTPFSTSDLLGTGPEQITNASKLLEDYNSLCEAGMKLLSALYVLQTEAHSNARLRDALGGSGGELIAKLGNEGEVLLRKLNFCEFDISIQGEGGDGV